MSDDETTTILTRQIQEDVLTLLDQQRVVQVKNEHEYNIYLKEYDEAFSSAGLNADVRQIHPRKKNDTPFAVRLVMSNRNHE